MSSISVSNQKIKNLLLGKDSYNFEFLALKILLTKLQTKIKNEQTPENIEKGINEVKSLLEKFTHNPAVKKDMEKLS